MPIERRKIKFFKNDQTINRRELLLPKLELRRSEVLMFKLYNNLKNVYLDEFGELRTLGWNH